MSTGKPKIVVIDNYDSFVYILVQYLGEMGASPVVYRNDAVTLQQIVDSEPDGILISPGPGRPEDAEVSNDVLEELTGRIPIFGVCLGLQCMAQVFGGRVIRAPLAMHGKLSMVNHDDVGVMRGLPNPMRVTRYHSLIAENETLPDVLEVTATTDDDLIMALRHREHYVEGVQFHPESVLSDQGRLIVENFLRTCQTCQR